MKKNTRKQLLQKIDELEARLAFAEKVVGWDSAYGCYTRAGMEGLIWPVIEKDVEYIIAMDIDDMHGLNRSLGHKNMDRRIRKGLRVRRSDLASVARIASGDEVGLFVCRNAERPAIDPEGMVARLTQQFADLGITVTFAIYRKRGKSFIKNIESAFALVEEKKNSRKLAGELKGRD